MLIKIERLNLKTVLSLPLLLALFMMFSINEASAQYRQCPNGVWVSTDGDFPPSANPGECYSKCISKEAREGETAWKQVICPSAMTQKYMNKVTKALSTKGYTVGKGAIKKEKSNRYRLDDTTKTALLKFQKENDLSVGKLYVETAKSLGLSTK